ncbi:MAG: hypothetical protein ACJAZP_001733 [Psychromonas sp.]|jgi:hypothetical protein|uniref:hypothetical protein n=1 Tax=Psychromonas sp. TaxID=1884585 RepID=UPI0039E34EF4
MIKTIYFRTGNSGSGFIGKLLSDAGITALCIIPDWLLAVKRLNKSSKLSEE